MTSCLSFAKSSRCEFVSKALRLFNSQRSGKFVVAQHGVHADPSTGSGQRGWILTVKIGFFVASGFIRFEGESRPASRR